MNNLDYDHIPIPINRDNKVIVQRSAIKIDEICRRVIKGKGTKYKLVKRLFFDMMTPFFAMMGKPVISALKLKAMEPEESNLDCRELIPLQTLADKRDNTTDVPHDYIELAAPVKTRYLKLTNYHVPSGTFALAGLRVFGNGGGQAPSKVNDFKIERSEKDRCVAKINWAKNPDAVGYNINFGYAPDKLYHTYQVIDNDSVTINSLSSFQKYYFSIDAFNENGVTKADSTIEVK
jgi:hypothetical protein